MRYITSNNDFDQHAQYTEKEAFKSRYIKYKFIVNSDFLKKCKKPLNHAIWNSLFEEHILSEESSSDNDLNISYLDEYEKSIQPREDKRRYIDETSNSKRGFKWPSGQLSCVKRLCR